MSISHHYRKSGRIAVFVLLAAAMLGLDGTAQVLRDKTHPQQEETQPAPPSKPTKRGPRALAVVEFMPGGVARLVPVALWIDGHFYDASLYGANPEPMALEPETVYEATDYGETTGLFTVTLPEEVKGSWVGTGKWKPQSAFDAMAAKQAANQPKAAPRHFDVNSERPILRRPGSSASPSTDSASAAPPAGNNPPPKDEPADRPVLKKPAAPPPAEAPATTANGSAATPSDSAAKTTSPDEGDPNRPVLRHGKPTATAAAVPLAAPAPSSNKPAATSATVQPAKASVGAGAAPDVSGRRHSFPAISDAGAYHTRSLLYAMNSAERGEREEQMRALALQEIQTFIATRKTSPLPKNAGITSFDLRAYDLDYSNSPTLVLTAVLPVPGAKALRGGEFDYFTTVVARQDINGAPIKIFSSVTDSNHLDVFPRMEIIDAVDADANGRGDLLFRQYSDTGVSYSLYRVFPYEMRKIFEGGASA